MNKRTTIFIGVGIAVLIVLGILTTLVGGVSIRRVQPLVDVTMNIHSPLVPGVGTKIEWDVPSDLTNQQVDVVLRTKAGNAVIGTAQLFAKEVLVTPPCQEESDSAATISLVGSDSKEVLSWQEVEMLPAGPDCF